MSYIKIILSICISCGVLFSYTYADKINTQTPTTLRVTQELSREDSFIQIANIYKNNIPDSYQYITLNFKNISSGSDLEAALKILVYTGVIQNARSDIHPSKPMNAYVFYKIAEKITGSPLLSKSELQKTKERNVLPSDHTQLELVISGDDSVIDVYNSDSKTVQQKKKILLDVYTTLKKSHIDKDTLQGSDLIDSAIE